MKHMIMNAELLDVTCDGSVVLLGSKHKRYAEALAAAAESRHGWPWIDAETADDELVNVVAETWRVIAPGWLPDVRGMLCGAIGRHLHMAGHLWIDARRAEAVRRLRSNPTLADKTVLGFLGYDDTAGAYSVAGLLAVDGSAIADVGATLDVDAFDNDRIDCIVPRATRGASIADWVIERTDD